jgi:outer membrane protein OmpA-like peptidoglycan-associated protein
MMGLHAAKKDFVRLAAVLALALSASGCSTMSDMVPDMPSVPDWVDPTTWFGGDDTSTTTTTTDNSQTPDLANLPQKPQTTTPDDQKEATDTLAAAGNQAKYSAEALRGGTEAAAAPPPNEAPVKVADMEIPVSSAPAASKREAPTPPPVPQTDQSVVAAPAGPAAPGTLPAPPPGMPVQVASVAPPVPAPAPAEAPAAPAATPSVAPAVPAVPMQTASIAPSDAALGFKPSAAPPLDPSVSQFVAPTIIARYDQTASQAGLAAPAPTGVAAAEPVKSRRSHKPVPMGEGGPETMTGAVVANLSALEPGAATYAPYASPQGVMPTAVIFFPGDTVGLNAAAREQIRAAAEQYKAQGGAGYVRVVGHSSSRTANMPLEKHLELVFKKSQERAAAVTQELIRDGVPADKVLSSAVGDSQPVYYESMPKGEDGNRRAEIFLQS